MAVLIASFYITKSFANIVNYSLKLFKSLEIFLKTIKQTWSILLQDRSLRYVSQEVDKPFNVGKAGDANNY